MTGASAGAGGGPSSPAFRLCGEDGRAEWLRFYDLVEAQVEALAADRAHLGATRGEGEEAIPPADRLAELQEGDLEDVSACRGLLALRNTESKQVQDRLELGENTGDHEHIVKALRANLRKLKGAFETLLSKKDKDVYSVKDVLLNQFRTMQKDNTLFENKKLEAAQATEEAKKHQQNVQVLHVAAQNKDDEIGRLQAETLVAQQKLHEMDSLLKEKDESIEKLHAENIGVLAVKDFLWSQFQIKEQELLDYAMLLKNKEVAAAEATEEAKKHQQNVQALHVAAQNKDDEIGRLQAEALLAQQKLHEMDSLLKEKDESIEKFRAENIGLLAVKDFLWSQFQIKEQELRDYAMLLKNKEVVAAQATKAAQKLVKENCMMEAEVVDYGNKLLILEDKLKETHFLAKEKDDEIQKLKNRQHEITSLKRKCASSLSNETSKKRRTDIIGMHIACIRRCKPGRQCLGRRMMQIFVKTTNCRTYTLKVKSSNKVEDVEAKMRDHHLDVQGLIFAGKKLVYGRTLADYNIKNLSTLQLVLHLHISVKMLNGKFIDFEVKSSDTIKHVKAMIQSQEDVPWDEQGLTFSGKRLEDGCTLADYNIETLCTFELVPFLRLRVKIIDPAGLWILSSAVTIKGVKANGKIIDLAILSSADTMKDVKAMIYDQEGIPLYVQQFIFADGLLRDDQGLQTLEKYGIRKNCTIRLLLRLDGYRVIRIKTLMGKTISPAVDIKDTIEDVKAMIHKEEGIPPSQQRLFFAGKPLHNDRTLESYISGDLSVIAIHLLHRRALQPRRIVDRARRLLNRQKFGQGCV